MTFAIRASRFASGLLLLLLLVAGCPPASSLRLDDPYRDSDVVFAGKVLEYDDEPPRVDADGDLYAEVTYTVEEVYKGNVPATVVISQLVPRYASPLTEPDRRLRRSVFGSGRRLVVFAQRDGSRLRCQSPTDATPEVIERLEALQRRK